MSPMLVIDDWLSSDDARVDERVSAPIAVPEAGSFVGGGYRILGTLGKGSMGVVLLAYDETLDRRVAIKFTLPNRLDPGLRKRSRDEARAMARVNHPNVLQVYAVGEHDSAPYIVMEFVEGRTLGQWLAQQTSPPHVDLALRILDGVCLGVAAIHARNTVHHDIKPSNILLDAQLRPRVADLGLSALCPRDGAAQYELGGTPAYMAPEIAFSHGSDPALGPRADVYSLACVAYELFTGRPPFDGAGTMGLLLQHATAPVPPPSGLRAGFPEELDRVVLRALAKDPRTRTPSIEAFRNELIAARQGKFDPERILLAEDDDDFREALESILVSAFPQAEIECVPDGLTALRAFERKAPSVTILDLHMPGIDGMELTKRLRGRSTSAAMPIIVLTASGGPSEWRQLAAFGADRFLLKPVMADDVVASVRQALGERSAGASQPVYGRKEPGTGRARQSLEWRAGWLG
jgi:eukaryotic-like serine/threonine-protein kinase